LVYCPCSYCFFCVLHYGPLEFSKDQESETMSYLHEIPDDSWDGPDTDDPLSLVDKIELALAYGCEDSLSQRDVLQYVHHNRNNNARQINTIGSNMEEKEIEMDEQIALQERKTEEQMKNIESKILENCEENTLIQNRKLSDQEKRISEQEIKMAEQEHSLTEQRNQITQEETKREELERIMTEQESLQRNNTLKLEKALGEQAKKDKFTTK